MNFWRRALTNPVLYVLVAFNAYFIYEYKQHPESYPTIVWIFWCQSVLIGLFNFLELLTTRTINTDGFKVNDEPFDPNKGRGCSALFFLVHYGGFHLGYFVFIAIKVGFSNIDPVIFKFSLLLLFINQTFTFFRHKQAYKTAAPGIAYLFFAPYLRIIPMHLMILVPAFLGWHPAMIFLTLKMFMDIVGYLLTLSFTTKGMTPQVI